jgi:hypothetical protein
MPSPDKSVQPNDLPITKQPDPVAFFDTILEQFQQAEATAGGPIDQVFNKIDNYTIRLRFAGTALVTALTPALDHLTITSAAPPDLTICIWDSTSTQITWPKLPWFQYPGHINAKGEKIENLYTPRGDIRGYNNSRIQTHVGDKVFSLLDLERNLAIYWCQNASTLPLYERGAPLRSILHWWLRQRGLQLIHAGAVGTATGGVLLAGKGGSGKSTTALTCLKSDLLYLSDDYSLVKTDPEPYVYTIYNTAKVRPDNLQRVPHLRHTLTNGDCLNSEKALFFIHQHYPEKIVNRLPIRAILLPRVTGRPDTTLETASPRDSLTALTLSTLHQLAGSGKELLQTINQLVNQVPSYHLNLGTDLAQIPGVIANVLRKESP